MDKWHAILLLLMSLVVICSGETVYVNDGTTLESYLCPKGNSTLSPNTTLILNSTTLNLEFSEEFCLVENTSDITIAASEELIGDDGNYVTIDCSIWPWGFGFFNVTNLVITSIRFHCLASKTLPPSAMRYINDTDQFLYFDDNGVEVGLLFNHCSNVTIDNLYLSPMGDFSVIGVNLCGHNTVSIPLLSPHDIFVLFYYTDSHVHLSNTECVLNVKSNALSSLFRMEPFEEEYLSNKPNRIPLGKPKFGFFLVLAQQTFTANVNINIMPKLFDSIFLATMTGLILFVNSVTDSQVIFQGLSYDYCINELYIPNGSDYSLGLKVIFYETPNFTSSVDHVAPSLHIKDTSFILYTNEDKPLSTYRFSASLQIIEIPGEISYQISLANVSWCTKNVLNHDTEQIYSTLPHLLQIQTFSEDSSGKTGNLHVSMNNVHMQHNDYQESVIVPYIAQSSVNFVNVESITMSGTNYLAVGNGGSIINIISCNLILTGYMIIKDGHAFEGGGIKLDGSSTLFLKEPLTVQFINNTAYQGSAIYAPVGIKDFEKTSPIQVLPNQVYSLHNISDINITLYFEGNLDENLNAPVSIYAPQLSFLYAQVTPNFSFSQSQWDNDHSQYACTTLLDSIMFFEEANDTDKYTSLSNGICTQIRRKPWNCIYIDIHYNKYIPPDQYLQIIHTYPGERILSVLYTKNKEFSIMNCTGFQYTQSKYYTLTKSTSTLSFTFLNEEKKDHCFLIVVSNAEVQELTVQLFKVIMNATCPPGLDLTDKGYCDCISALQVHDYACNISSRIFMSPIDYWTGYEEHNTTNTTSYTITFSSHCPPNYCDQKFQIFLLDSSITDLSCKNSRTGIICGQCKSDFSAMFGSDACSDCNDVYLLTLLAYGLAGLLLVVILFALKLTVAVGTINGVIFYANILGLSMDKLTEGYHGPHLTFFRIVISLLNLDLGFPLCFYEGMTTTDKIGLQFVFPMYIWGIVIGMIIVAKCSIRVANCIPSAVQVLATLFYLSFPKLLRTVIDIMTYSTITLVVFDPDKNNSYLNREQTVWFYSGEEYGKGVHGFYLFLASVFILFFLLYTILTTFSYYFMRFKLVNKFKPFIDAYGGPFKDEWRFWFGLRLWIVVLLFSVSGALRGTDTDSLFIFNLIILLIFIQIQSFARPFKSHIIFMMDLFFMINYWLIILFYLVSKTNFIDAYSFLLSGAILVLVLILFSHFCYVYIYSKNPGVFLQVKIMFCKRFRGYKRIEEQQENEEADMQVFKAAEERVIDTY